MPLLNTKAGMKKILLALVLLYAGLAAADAKSGFGIKAGLNFSTADIKEINAGTLTRYQAGIAYNLDLPLGFSVQPSLVYNVKGASLGVEDIASTDLSVGYLELMASLQWGPDLLIFRPFFDITPFVGYGINGSFGEIKDIWSGDGLNRLEYGLGLGAGLDIWRFQVVCRYNWNFGGLLKTTKAAEDGFGFSDAYNTMKNGNFGGVSLSIAYFF